MKLTPFQLTRVVEVIRLWPFFVNGFKAIAKYTDRPANIDNVRKVLFWLVREPEHAWIGVTFENNIPICFAVLEDMTPQFDPVRKFEVRYFYHQPDRFDATLVLMKEFESWAKKQGVHKYVITTSRDSGAAIRCFQSARYGFKRKQILFEKVLT